MFKVSFKESSKNPSKMVLKTARKTEVMLRGTVSLPEFWHTIPEEISEWIRYRLRLEIYEDIADNTMIIYSKGTAKCDMEDKYDPILGERIAESKAKLYIYTFMENLTHRLYDYYGSILFGSGIVYSSEHGLSKAHSKYLGLCITEARHIGKLLEEVEHGNSV